MTEKIYIEYSEEQLQNYLIKNLKEHFPELKLLKSEFEIPQGRIDLLCKSTEEKDTYWVIEIKTGTITSDSAIQVLRYTQYLNSEMSKNGKRTFKPLLIGRDLDNTSTHLNKFLKFYNPDLLCENCFLCFYCIYNFDIEHMQFKFNYYNIQNGEYIDNFFNKRYSYISKLYDDIESVCYDNYLLLSKGEKK